MAIVYINEHPNYNYASVVLNGYCDLRDYVQSKEYLSWTPQLRGNGCFQLMIRGKDEHPEHLNDFINHVKEMGCEVKLRKNRGDKWDTV